MTRKRLTEWRSFAKMHYEGGNHLNAAMAFSQLPGKLGEGDPVSVCVATGILRCNISVMTGS
jgi:hypothetical protein